MPDVLESDRCAAMMRAMADPERLRIVDCLRDGPKNVGQIACLLGSEAVNVSHHLGILKQTGIVDRSKEGRFAVYRLHPGVFRPARGAAAKDYLDFGCCRLEIPKA